MATYAYHCADCGPFEVRRPIGTAGPAEPCAACGAPAPRRYTPPLLARTPAAEGRARQAQEAAAHEPQVVRHVPAARSRPAPPPDPRWAGLPRP
ncbi:putative FmdB family regulatory protein [Nonomuraea thailandensis]|uniref:FmdB family regulatory protein n=1 Tax=Nonomuraea thailandensis TaxID=1188745 RepID=A0A9X2GML1_9ACTN|nr:FmdB family zinc ribbon protein [Nonomuraea thailandensis]MCP2360537.1 putative FmdB family regulatory protein [Nonomuraea thailandensis]